MHRIFIELTEEQKEQLKPLFDGVVKCNFENIHYAIGAQIFSDGIHAKLIVGDKAEALARELGGDIKDKAYSAKQAFEEGLERDIAEQGVTA